MYYLLRREDRQERARLKRQREFLASRCCRCGSAEHKTRDHWAPKRHRDHWPEYARNMTVPLCEEEHRDLTRLRWFLELRDWTHEHRHVYPLEFYGELIIWAIDSRNDLQGVVDALFRAQKRPLARVAIDPKFVEICQRYGGMCFQLVHTGGNRYRVSWEEGLWGEVAQS